MGNEEYAEQEIVPNGSRMASAQSEIGFSGPDDHHKIQTTTQPEFKPILLNWYEAEVLHTLSLRRRSIGTDLLKISKLGEEIDYKMERRGRVNSLTWLAKKNYIELQYDEKGRLYCNLTSMGKYLAEAVKLQRSRKITKQSPWVTPSYP